MKKKLFESDQHFMERVRREEIEAKTGVEKRLFESDEHYEKRANKEYLDKNAGIDRKLFESKKHFERRQEAALTERITGITRMPGESYEDFTVRAEREALCRKHHIFQDKHGHHHGGISEEEHARNQIYAMEEIANVRREFHETDHDYYHRVRISALAAIGHTQREPFESLEAFIIRSRIEALRYDPELVEMLGLNKWEEEECLHPERGEHHHG